MTQLTKGEILDDVVPQLMAHTTILAALVAKNVGSAANPRDALKHFSEGIHRSLAPLYGDERAPTSYKERIRKHVDEVISAAAKNFG